MNSIKIFQNAHDLSVLVGNSYSEDQLMHTFLDNFEQGGKYLAHIANQQEELIRVGKITDQKSLNISSLQTEYLNLDSSSGFDRDIERAHDVQTECTFCGGVNHSAEQCFKTIKKENEKVPRWMFHLIYKWNVRLVNDLDVDLKIILLKNVQIKYVLIKKVIMQAKTAKIIVTARYMHLWHKCLAMKNGIIMVKLKTETEHLCKRGDIVQDSLWNKSYV